MKSFISGIVIVLVLGSLFFTAGCKNKGALSVSHSAQADTSVEMRVGILPTMDCLPAVYALKNGIFDSLGVHVQLVPYSSAMDCDTAFINRHIDGMFTDVVRGILMNTRQNCKIVMSTPAEWGLFSNKNIRLKRLPQIKERTIALARHSATDFLSDYICEKTAIEEDEIHRPQINDIQLRLKMLSNNQIDLAFLPQPQASMAKAMGNRKLFSTGEEHLKLGALVFSTDYIKKKAAMRRLQLFVRGYDEACKLLKNKKAVGVKNILVQDFQVPETLVDSIAIPAYQPYSLPEKKDIGAVNAWLQKRKLVSSSLLTDTCFLSVNS